MKRLFAKSVSDYLGTDHTELYLSSTDAVGIIETLPNIYDEPFADSSQIPFVLLSLLAGKHVGVSLSGDGGDELFAGYSRYTEATRLWSYIQPLPLKLRTLLASLFLGLDHKIQPLLFLILSTSAGSTRNGRKLLRLCYLMRSTNPGDFYRRVMSQWQATEDILLSPDVNSHFPGHYFDTLSLLDAMRICDLDNYLPDDLLVKTDRASMSASLELRSPFLDFRLVELAFALPINCLIHHGTSKYILRNILGEYLPATLFDRPKAGFSIPLAQWLRGSLRDWAESLLSPTLVKQQGYLNSSKVTEYWQQHLNEEYDHSLFLWHILMFQ